MSYLEVQGRCFICCSCSWLGKGACFSFLLACCYLVYFLTFGKKAIATTGVPFRAENQRNRKSGLDKTVHRTESTPLFMMDVTCALRVDLFNYRDSSSSNRAKGHCDTGTCVIVVPWPWRWSMLTGDLMSHWWAGCKDVAESFRTHSTQHTAYSIH